MAKAKRPAGKKTAKAAKKATKSVKKPAATGKPKPGDDALYVEQVRQLVDMMVANDLTTLEIVNDDLKVSLGRGAVVASVPVAAASPAPAAAPAAAGAPAGKDAPVEKAPAEDLNEVKSPMVGTFYSAPSPDSAPYVGEGDRVTPETVVCIVEAMKVMNEIKAECSGTIVEVAAKNGQPVEFGQTLFRVRP